MDPTEARSDAMRGILRDANQCMLVGRGCPDELVARYNRVGWDGAKHSAITEIDAWIWHASVTLSRSRAWGRPSPELERALNLTLRLYYGSEDGTADQMSRPHVLYVASHGGDALVPAFARGAASTDPIGLRPNDGWRSDSVAAAMAPVVGEGRARYCAALARVAKHGSQRFTVPISRTASHPWSPFFDDSEWDRMHEALRLADVFELARHRYSPPAGEHYECVLEHDGRDDGKTERLLATLAGKPSAAGLAAAISLYTNGEAPPAGLEWERVLLGLPHAEMLGLPRAHGAKLKGAQVLLSVLEEGTRAAIARALDIDPNEMRRIERKFSEVEGREKP